MTLVDDVPQVPAATFDVDQVFATVIEHLRSESPDSSLPTVHRFQQRLDSLETDLLAERRREGASPREVEEAAGRGSTRSAAEARKRSKRAEVLTHNPDLASDLDEGRLTGEHLDALATASEQSDGEAARDDSLIDRLTNVNPDQAWSVSRNWIDQQRDADEVEANHQRQRRLRTARRFTTDRGTKAIFAEGDDPTIDAIWEAIVARSRQLYADDGGRDVPAAKRPRTRDQRLFDALHQLTTGAASDTDDPAQPARPTAILVAPIDAVGADSDTQAELLGTGVIPRSVLDRLLCQADLIGAVFSTAGEPLWVGRRIRMVTQGQWRALVARDRGCVLCGAHPNRCEAHHVVPFEAPAKGRTDITNLVLVCTDCHHHIHDTRQTLFFDDEAGSWKLRPATPDELPPPRANPPP